MGVDRLITRIMVARMEILKFQIARKFRPQLLRKYRTTFSFLLQIVLTIIVILMGQLLGKFLLLNMSSQIVIKSARLKNFRAFKQQLEIVLMEIRSSNLQLSKVLNK